MFLKYEPTKFCKSTDIQSVLVDDDVQIDRPTDRQTDRQLRLRLIITLTWQKWKKRGP